MKTSILVFLSIVISLYFLVNFYIYIRGLQAFQFSGNARLVYRITFLLLFLSFIAERVFGGTIPNFFTQSITWIGSFWLAAMLYFFLFILLFDIIRLSNYFFHFFPEIIVKNYAKAKFISGILVLVSVFLLIGIGYFNSINTKIRQFDINIDKKAGNLKTLKIAMVSDIHMGKIIRNKRIEQMVSLINEQKPDIVLLAGDMLDHELLPVIHYKTGSLLNNLKSKYGTYAVLGNHEYIGGKEQAVSYIKTLNIRLLVDSSVCIDSAFYVLGRDDKDNKRFGGKSRLPINALMQEIDKSLPIILLDHQPFNLKQAQDAGIDLQLSGHTHQGQMFPINALVNSIFEKAYGYLKKGNTHYYISSGYGGWGPPVRIATNSEIVILNLQFK